MTHQFIRVPNAFFVRLQHEQQNTISDLADTITTQCDLLQATDFRNVAPGDALAELLPQYIANLVRVEPIAQAEGS